MKIANSKGDKMDNRRNSLPKKDKKKEMLLESKITGLPPLNINGQIKKKKNQKNSPTANITPKRYNRIN